MRCIFWSLLRVITQTNRSILNSWDKRTYWLVRRTYWQEKLVMGKDNMVSKDARVPGVRQPRRTHTLHEKINGLSLPLIHRITGLQHVHGLSMIYRLLIADTFYMIIYLSVVREKTPSREKENLQLPLMDLTGIRGSKFTSLVQWAAKSK